MLLFSFAFLLLSSPEATTFVQLETTHRRFSSGLFQINHKTGEIFFNNKTEIYIIDTSGKIKSIPFSIEEDAWIANFSIIENNRKLFISTLKRFENGNGFKKRSFIFDLDLKTENKCFSVNENGWESIDVYYRQLYDLNGRFFVNRWEAGSGIYDNERRMLEEVNLFSESNPSSIHHGYRPFHASFNRRNNAFSAHKKKWIELVEAPSNQDSPSTEPQQELLVVDELLPKLHFYSEHLKEDLVEWRFEGYIGLDLKGWKNVYPRPSHMKFPAYLETFSKITGFYPVGNNEYLLGHENPNEKGRKLIIQTISDSGEVLRKVNFFWDSLFIGVTNQKTHSHYYIVDNYKIENQKISFKLSKYALN